jgi:hypothetical protein
MADDPAGEQPHSRAFACLVQDNKDTVGLLAYALFKQSINEAAQNGGDIRPRPRALSPTEVTTYRHAAESIIGEAVERTLTENLLEIQQSAAIETVKAEAASVRAHIDTRTSFGAALLTNIVAWIVTLAATVLIIWLSAAPDLGRLLAGKEEPATIAPAIAQKPVQ